MPLTRHFAQNLTFVAMNDLPYLFSSPMGIQGTTIVFLAIIDLIDTVVANLVPLQIASNMVVSTSTVSTAPTVVSQNWSPEICIPLTELPHR